MYTYSKISWTQVGDGVINEYQEVKLLKCNIFGEYAPKLPKPSHSLTQTQKIHVQMGETSLPHGFGV